MARKCSALRAEQISGGFAQAKKKLVLQFQGKDYLEEDILEKVKEELLTRGIHEEDMEKIDIYVKPEEKQIYYVVNQDITGSMKLQNTQ